MIIYPQGKALQAMRMQLGPAGLRYRIDRSDQVWSVHFISFDQFTFWRCLDTFQLTGVNTRDKSGKTPLHTAILSKQHTIVDMLLNHGADVTVTDDAGDTPLHTAIYVGSERLVLVSIVTICFIDVLVHCSKFPLLWLWLAFLFLLVSFRRSDCFFFIHKKMCKHFQKSVWSVHCWRSFRYVFSKKTFLLLQW